MHNNESPSTWQWRLRFEDEALWAALPEEVRERCRSLCTQLLASVLHKDERRQNERED
jgi:hypothetical protein